MAIKKEKKVKEKKPKKEKREKGESSGKKKLLFILIPVILVVVAAGGTAAYFFLFKKAPEFYWDEKEKVSSVTEVVGKRKCKEKKSDNSVTYTYKGAKSTASDIKKYVTYLTDEKKFVDIEMPDLKEDEEAQDTADTGDEDTKKEKTEKKKKHYELGVDSATSKKKYLYAVIDVKKDSYTIKVQMKKGSVDDKLDKIEAEIEKAERKKLQEENPHSFTDAVDKIQSLPPEQLGLSMPNEQLSFIPHAGRTLIDTTEYYKVTVYSRDENGSNCYQGSYLTDCRTITELLKYDEQTKEAVPLG